MPFEASHYNPSTAVSTKSRWSSLDSSSCLADLGSVHCGWFQHDAPKSGRIPGLVACYGGELCSKVRSIKSSTEENE